MSIVVELASGLVWERLLSWLVVASRLVPIVVLAPFLGGKATPQPVKLALAGGLTLIVWPLVGAPATMGIAEMSIVLAQEAFVGFCIGYASSLAFESMRIAGQVTDVMRGQSMATALVPQLPERVSVSANVLYQLSVAVFLLSGAHRVFLDLLCHSYRVVPVGEVLLLEPIEFSFWARLIADAVGVGVLLSFPVVASILLADVVLGLVNRAAPGLSVFFLGMPLKAMLGVGILALSLDAMSDRFMDTAAENLELLELWLRSVTG